MQDEQTGFTGTIDLVVVGELNIDLILEQLNELPALEKERRAQNMVFTLGSSSAIMASNARALGLSVGFVGLVGADMFGSFVQKTLAERGVDVSEVRVLDEVSTGATVIYTHGDQRGMITYPGAMDHLTIKAIPWAYVERARHLHVSSLFLQRGLRKDCRALFTRARDAGLTTSLDTGWDPDDAWTVDVPSLLEVVDVFFPNDDEARRISGKSDLEEALEVLSACGTTVVITCGADGVLAKHEDRVVHLPAVAVEPVDAVGAGDSFNAGFLERYLQGCSLEDCLRAGLLAGAFSTQAAGGTAAFEKGGFRAFARRYS